MSTPYTPQHFFLAVTTSISSKSFNVDAGRINMLNTGAFACWFTLDGTAPVASDGDGRSQLPPGVAYSLSMTGVSVLKAICASGGSAGIQIIITPSGGE